MRKLSKDEYKGLKKAFKKSKFCDRKDYYETDVADAQFVTLSYFKRKETKTVKGTFDRPKELIDIERAMDKVAKTGDWLRIKVQEEKVFPSNLVPNVMLVQLKQDVDMMAWLKSYKSYGMIIDRSMVPNFNYLKVKYDLNTISSQDMLVKIRADERVQTVSFARKENQMNSGDQ